MPKQHIEYFTSPLGVIQIAANETALELVQFVYAPSSYLLPSALTQQCCTQLSEYFSGNRTQFTLPLDFSTSSPFEQSVWTALQQIPFSETTNYLSVAQSIGKPTASRAVGRACGSNRWMIVVPCHRVIASSGKLSGYAYGVQRKSALLEFERAQSKP